MGRKTNEEIKRLNEELAKAMAADQQLTLLLGQARAEIEYIKKQISEEAQKRGGQPELLQKKLTEKLEALKKETQEKVELSKQTSAPDRNALFDQIRKGGFNLKKIEKEAKSERTKPQSKSNSTENEVTGIDIQEMLRFQLNKGSKRESIKQRSPKEELSFLKKRVENFKKIVGNKHQNIEKLKNELTNARIELKAQKSDMFMDQIQKQKKLDAKIEKTKAQMAEDQKKLNNKRSELGTLQQELNLLNGSLEEQRNSLYPSPPLDAPPVPGNMLLSEGPPPVPMGSPFSSDGPPPVPTGSPFSSDGPPPVPAGSPFSTSLNKSGRKSTPLPIAATSENQSIKREEPLPLNEILSSNIPVAGTLNKAANPENELNLPENMMREARIIIMNIRKRIKTFRFESGDVKTAMVKRRYGMSGNEEDIKAEEIDLLFKMIAQEDKEAIEIQSRLKHFLLSIKELDKKRDEQVAFAQAKQMKRQAAKAHLKEKNMREARIDRLTKNGLLPKVDSKDAENFIKNQLVRSDQKRKDLKTELVECEKSHKARVSDQMEKCDQDINELREQIRFKKLELEELQKSGELRKVEKPQKTEKPQKHQRLPKDGLTATNPKPGAMEIEKPTRTSASAPTPSLINPSFKRAQREEKRPVNPKDRAFNAFTSSYKEKKKNTSFSIFKSFGMDSNKQLEMAEKLIQTVLNRSKKDNIEDVADEIINIIKENQDEHEKTTFARASAFNLNTLRELPEDLKKAVLKKLKISLSDPMMLQEVTIQHRRALAKILHDYDYTPSVPPIKSKKPKDRDPQDKRKPKKKE